MRKILKNIRPTCLYRGVGEMYYATCCLGEFSRVMHVHNFKQSFGKLTCSALSNYTSGWIGPPSTVARFKFDINKTTNVSFNGWFRYSRTGRFEIVLHVSNRWISPSEILKASTDVASPRCFVNEVPRTQSVTWKRLITCCAENVPIHFSDAHQWEVRDCHPARYWPAGVRVPREELVHRSRTTPPLFRKNIL